MLDISIVITALPKIHRALDFSPVALSWVQNALVALAAVTALARALDVPYPIVLVLGGSVIGFLPGVPDVELDPDLVLLIVLPLFQAAVFASVGERRANARADLAERLRARAPDHGDGDHPRRHARPAMGCGLRARLLPCPAGYGPVSSAWPLDGIFVGRGATVASGLSRRRRLPARRGGR